MGPHPPNYRTATQHIAIDGCLTVTLGTRAVGSLLKEGELQLTSDTAKVLRRPPTKSTKTDHQPMKAAGEATP
jgi:hypothetical protein